MSTRQLRKLQKQKELEALEKGASPAAGLEDESEYEKPVQKPKKNVFAGFAALGGMDDEPEEDHDDEDAKEESAEPANAPSRVEPESTELSKPTSKKNKKKKKKGKKSEQTSTPVSKPPPASNEQDEIDRALEELNLAKKAADASGAGVGPPAVKAYERICELLRVNTHHLKVINEMRHLFGREAIAAAQSEEEEEQAARSRRARQTLQQNVDLETYLKGVPGKTLPEVTLRRNPFLPGKETWPRAATEGLTMKQIKEGDATMEPGSVEFAFAHDETYNGLESNFFNLVQMYDPMQLVHFLHRHPYHISSLIQVSKVAKQDQNSALSADLCERALFTFGRVSISAFRQKLEEGKARLDFRRPENRQFWLAGYHYLKSLVMKGTYRTALEWAKLLLSMDLSDPYGIIHFIHPLAIRAHESKWFIDFCDSEALDECDTAQDYIRQTLVLARLQQKDFAGAKALLTEGMERIPWLYSDLFKALGLDIPKAIWGMQPRNKHESLFVELYIHLTKNLWDNAQTISLLKDAASEAKKPDWASFSQTPLAKSNVARFIYLDNTPALMGLVPGGMLSASPNWEFDPLPPALEENIFSHDSQKQPWNPTGRVETTGTHNRNQLRELLQRLRRDGAPLDVQQVLHRAMAGGDPDERHRDRAEDDWEAGGPMPWVDDDLSDHESDEFVLAGEDVEDPEEGAPPGANFARWFNSFFDLIGAGPPGAALPDRLGPGVLGTGMPGQFVDEDDEEHSDDEMPHLEPAEFPARPQDGRGSSDDDDDDDEEMPGLVPQ